MGLQKIQDIEHIWKNTVLHIYFAFNSKCTWNTNSFHVYHLNKYSWNHEAKQTSIISLPTRLFFFSIHTESFNAAPVRTTAINLFLFAKLIQCWIHSKKDFLHLSPLSFTCSVPLQFVPIMSVYSACLGFSAVKLMRGIVTVTGFLTWAMMKSQY